MERMHATIGLGDRATRSHQCLCGYLAAVGPKGAPEWQMPVKMSLSMGVRANRSTKCSRWSGSVTQQTLVLSCGSASKWSRPGGIGE